MTVAIALERQARDFLNPFHERPSRLEETIARAFGIKNVHSPNPYLESAAAALLVSGPALGAWLGNQYGLDHAFLDGILHEDLLRDIREGRLPSGANALIGGISGGALSITAGFAGAVALANLSRIKRAVDKGVEGAVTLYRTAADSATRFMDDARRYRFTYGDKRHLLNTSYLLENNMEGRFGGEDYSRLWQEFRDRVFAAKKDQLKQLESLSDDIVSLDSSLHVVDYSLKQEELDPEVEARTRELIGSRLSIASLDEPETLKEIRDYLSGAGRGLRAAAAHTFYGAKDVHLSPSVPDHSDLTVEVGGLFSAHGDERVYIDLDTLSVGNEYGIRFWGTPGEEDMGIWHLHYGDHHPIPSSEDLIPSILGSHMRFDVYPHIITSPHKGTRLYVPEFLLDLADPSLKEQAVKYDTAEREAELKEIGLTGKLLEIELQFPMPDSMYYLEIGPR